MSKHSLRLLAAIVTSLAMLLAFVAWGQTFDWQFAGLSSYQLFPLFGLLAFSIMWPHYLVGALRRHFGYAKTDFTDYFELTSGMVLVFILAHPGLLVWQLWRDGSGLPPSSTSNYVAPALRTSVILGVISLFVFLLFELWRVYGQRPWWRFVEYVTDLSMILIFVHALRLGGQLQTGWFRAVWLFYGVTLVLAMGYIYWHKTMETSVPLVKS